jgi:urease beta subunit
VAGEILCRDGQIEINSGRATRTLTVANTGDRPIQIGSHYHFYEVNRALAFDREKAFGMRLNIPSGTSVRFEPGQEQRVELVALGGERVVWGLRGLANGPAEVKEGAPE